MAKWNIELVLVPSTSIAGPRAGTGSRPGRSGTAIRPRCCLSGSRRHPIRRRRRTASADTLREGPVQLRSRASELRGRVPSRSPAVPPGAPACRGRRGFRAPPSPIPSRSPHLGTARSPVEDAVPLPAEVVPQRLVVNRLCPPEPETCIRPTPRYGRPPPRWRASPRGFLRAHRSSRRPSGVMPSILHQGFKCRRPGREHRPSLFPSQQSGEIVEGGFLAELTGARASGFMRCERHQEH